MRPTSYFPFEVSCFLFGRLHDFSTSCYINLFNLLYYCRTYNLNTWVQAGSFCCVLLFSKRLQAYVYNHKACWASPGFGVTVTPQNMCCAVCILLIPVRTSNYLHRDLSCEEYCKATGYTRQSLCCDWHPRHVVVQKRNKQKKRNKRDRTCDTAWLFKPLRSLFFVILFFFLCFVWANSVWELPFCVVVSLSLRSGSFVFGFWEWEISDSVPLAMYRLLLEL